WQATDHAADMEGFEGRLMEHFGKYPGIVVRLAPTLAHLWWCVKKDAPPPTEIPESAVAAALALVEGYYKPMARRVYGAAGKSDRELRAYTLAEWIRRNKPTMVNTREIRRTPGIEGLAQKTAVEQAVEELVDAGWLRRIPHNG